MPTETLIHEKSETEEGKKNTNSELSANVSTLHFHTEEFIVTTVEISIGWKRSKERGKESGHALRKKT